MPENTAVDPRRLYVLSYLKVAKREFEPKNAFEAFFPFIVAAADPKAGAPYDVAEIGSSLRAALGWNVGGDFVDLFTGMLHQRGLISGSTLNDYVWTAAAEKPEDDDATHDIEHLKSSFFEFTTKHSGLLLSNISADERMLQLAEALVGNRLFSATDLHEYIDRSEAERKLSTRRNASIDQADFDYLCARYIQAASKNDERAFTALIALASIGLVTQLTEFFHHRDDSLEVTGSPTIILDGPFLIDYLGFNGEIRRSDAMIIIDSAVKLNCKIWTFKHAVEEACSIVRTVLRSGPTDRYGPLAAALRNRWVAEEVLQAFIDDPFGIVQRLSILDRIFDIDYRNNKLQEDDFTEADWQAVYAKLINWKDQARVRDCNSVLGVMRLRAGRQTRNPWNSTHFLLTSNAKLADLSKEACVQQKLIDAKEIGPSISRNEFSAILWLAGASPLKSEAIKTHLLAAAQGMVARDRGLISRVHEYSANLSSARREMVDAIVQTELSYELFQDVTLGNPDRVTDESVAAVIQGLVSQGHDAGFREAREAELETTKRLRKAMVTKAALADDATHARDVAFQQAEDAQKESERLAAEAKAILEKNNRATDTISRVMSGSERTFTEKFASMYRLVSPGFWITYALFFAVVTYIGSLAKQAGIISATLILALGVGILLSFNEYLKTVRAALILKLSEKLTRRLIVREMRAAERQLGLTKNELKLEFVDREVKIVGFEELLARLTE